MIVKQIHNLLDEPELNSEDLLATYTDDLNTLLIKYSPFDRQIHLLQAEE